MKPCPYDREHYVKSHAYALSQRYVLLVMQAQEPLARGKEISCTALWPSARLSSKTSCVCTLGCGPSPGTRVSRLRRHSTCVPAIHPHMYPWPAPRRTFRKMSWKCTSLRRGPEPQWKISELHHLSTRASKLRWPHDSAARHTCGTGAGGSCAEQVLWRRSTRGET